MLIRNELKQGVKYVNVSFSDVIYVLKDAYIFVFEKDIFLGLLCVLSLLSSVKCDKRDNEDIDAVQ